MKKYTQSVITALVSVIVITMILFASESYAEATFDGQKLTLPSVVTPDGKQFEVLMACDLANLVCQVTDVREIVIVKQDVCKPGVTYFSPLPCVRR